MSRTWSSGWPVVTMLLALVAPLGLHAQDVDDEYFPPEVDRSLMISGFLAGHPDLAGRKHGMDAINRQHYARARTAFLRAARYGDKPSQAMLGEIYWKGLGVERDPVLGYVWMFLAAERGYYDFRAWSEAYWHEMTIAQRQQAQVRGPAIVAEYGDAVAVPRLEQAMRRALRQGTGSLVDPSGQMMVITSYDTTPPRGIDPERFYADMYWRPAEYHQLQDRLWKAPLHKRVDVGPVDDLSTRAGGASPAQ
jgi:hypothetical protein